MTAHYEAETRSLISRYQQSIFSLVLYLIGGDRNIAYDITVSAFVEALPRTPILGREEIFLVKLTAAAIVKSREANAMPSSDHPDFVKFSPEKRKSFEITQKALGKLPFPVKIYLLLRDQLHFPYKLTAAVLKMSEKDVRIQTSQARIQLREKLEEALRSG